jgi:hypothetical protein
VNNQFDEYLSSYGIVHQTTCPGTSEQNDLAERKNMHLLEIARCIMFAMNVPKFLWSEAVMPAAYLMNRMPSRVLDYKTPMECLTRNTTYVVPPKVFGCSCFVKDYRPSVGKLDARALKCIFVGYSGKKKGYKCWCPSERRMFVSMDVVFREHEPFYGEPTDLTNVFPDSFANDISDMETGGDKEKEKDDAASRKVIFGAVPDEDVSVLETEQGKAQEGQDDTSNEALQWPKPNEEHNPQVYTRRHRTEEEQVQGEETTPSECDPETEESPDMDYPTSSHTPLSSSSDGNAPP